MNGQIPETPNTQNEPVWTIAQAVQFLPLPAPLDRGTLSKLGREASMVARIWKRPAVAIPVLGKDWPAEKGYTADVLREVFTRNPATKAYMPETAQ